jgi:hypothetical protein
LFWPWSHLHLWFSTGDTYWLNKTDLL